MIQVFNKKKIDYSFLRTSIISFLSFYGMAYFTIASGVYYLIAIISVQYLFLVFIKILLWSVTTRVLPSFQGTKWIILRSLFLIDFYEAWKMDRIIWGQKPIISLMYNFGVIYNFIYAILLFDDSTSYTLRIIQLDSLDNSKLLSFCLMLVFVLSNASTNHAFVKFFQFNQGYQMNKINLILSKLYLFSFSFVQAFIVWQIFSASSIIGLVVLVIKIIVIIVFSRWIPNKNAASLSKVAKGIPIKQKQIKFLQSVLQCYLISGQTLDIAPFYRAFACKYDMMISHYTIKTLRAYQALESIVGLVLLYTQSSTQNHPQWFFIPCVCIIGYSVIVHVYYGLLCLLIAIKYPRQEIINIEDIANPGHSQIIEFNPNIQEENEPLLNDRLRQILSSSKFRNNPFLEMVQFCSNSTVVSQQLHQTIIEVLVFLWKERLFEQTNVILNKKILMENTREFTHLLITLENYEFALESLKVVDRIIPRNLTITIAGNILWTELDKLKPLMIRHLFQLELFVAASLDAQHLEKGVALTKWFTLLKFQRYSYQLSITGYYKFISQFMLNNPSMVLFDLLQID